MKINIYGAGLSAWVAAACLAKVGNDVVIDEMTGGELPSLAGLSIISDEPGLLAQIQRQITAGRLVRRQRELNTATDIHWLALQPSDQEIAERVVDSIRSLNVNDLLLINQCNFAVGATEGLQEKLGSTGEVVYVPDNLQEGSALESFIHPKQIILGIDGRGSLVKTKALFKPFSGNLDVLQLMTTREAEFTKFAITGMLALRLGYINELANLADQLDVDISVVQDGMGADPRVGHHYLAPGCGFGGQNFAAYVSTFSGILQREREASLLKTVLDENELQKELLFRKLWQYYGGDIKGKTVAIWGGAFKPGTASVDHAPSIKIINALVSQGANVRLHDPEAMANLQLHYSDEPLVSFVDEPLFAVDGADALLLVTEWAEYWSPDYVNLLALMRTPLIIDGRNVFDKQMLQQYGFEYIGVGR